MVGRHWRLMPLLSMLGLVTACSSGDGGRFTEGEATCVDLCPMYCDQVARCYADDVPFCVSRCEDAFPGCALVDEPLDLSCTPLLDHACENEVLTVECQAIATSCDDYCSELCSVASGCGSELSADECQRDCVGVNEGRFCGRAEAPDRLSCDVAVQTTECAGYCEALCDAASECVTLDIDQCTKDCRRDPLISCKKASIAPRSCDQLRAEALCYDPPSGSFSTCSLYSDETDYGLCTDSYDCADAEACNPSTSLCGACTSDAQCELGRIRDWGEDEPLQGLEDRPWACQEGACVELDCANDYHCSGSTTCDLETATCVECLDDGDCYGGGCDVSTHSCVECTQDSQCANKPFIGLPGVCDVTTFTCAECRADADCTSATFSTGRLCETRSMTCVECLQDEDCADTETCDDANECVTAG